MGSHSERDYVEKTIGLFDGLMLAANLIEATPGASASLVLKLCGASKVPFYLDPMTYAYGCYVDPETDQERGDLDWIKSEQKQGGKVIRTFKSSYAKLAEQLGSPFSDAIDRSSALTPEDFKSPEVVRAVCDSVCRYQSERIREEFRDPEYRDYANDVPTPAVLFTPYFYIGPLGWSEWLDLTLNLATVAARQQHGAPTHAVICADRSFLSSPEFLSTLKTKLPRTGVAGVWLWFSRFDEHRADLPELQAFKDLVKSMVAAGLVVYNLHGGYLSLALSKLGLKGVVQAVGYGEQKDVVPVVGQSSPTVRYYLPSLFRRVGVPDVERCFRSLEITSADRFFAKVCDCSICKGVIGKGLESFREFGDTRFSRPESRRRAQTPAAAKRCKFHFLLNRAKEKNQLKRESVGDICARLEAGTRLWADQPSLKDAGQHLPKWKKLLSPDTPVANKR